MAENKQIIWLASYPRSGNTYLRHVLEQVYGVPTYSMYQEGSSTARMGDRRAFFPTADKRPDDRIYFIKTHGSPTGIQRWWGEWRDRYPLLPSIDNAKAICIVRDGRDTLVSFAHYMRKLGLSSASFEATLKQLIMQTGPDDWSVYTACLLSWPGESVIVQFNEMITEPIATVQSALNTLGLSDEIKPLGGAELLLGFDELANRSPHIYRRGVRGSHLDEMTPDLHKLFWDKHGEMMLRLGYEYSANAIA